MRKEMYITVQNTSKLLNILALTEFTINLEITFS